MIITPPLEALMIVTPTGSLDDYHCTTGSLDCGDQVLERGLRSIHVKGPFIFVDVKNNSKQKDAIYSNWFTNGVIVAMENIKKRDKYSEDERIQPSKALWQSFLLAQRQDLHHTPIYLKKIVRSSAVNLSSHTAMWYAGRRSTSAIEGRKGYRVYTPRDEGYYAILGSQNGASTMRLLIDHKAELGFRTVEKVIVFMCRYRGDEQNDELARSFAVILSDPR